LPLGLKQPNPWPIVHIYPSTQKQTMQVLGTTSMSVIWNMIIFCNYINRYLPVATARNLAATIS
jgi:hypothetical protein